MEALCIQPGEVCGLTTGEREQPESVEDQLSNSSADEEDKEPQPPPIIRRKVSFADAFGLDLVSVVEFDHVESANLEPTAPSDREEGIPTEDAYMCCLFTVPPTPEKLEEKVQEQRLELESIELMPRTTTLRGVVRVLNLCYSKRVYARMTLDGWKSHFDLLAEYMPGSSDRKTDRFTFQYTLAPPFDKKGTRLEFCLRYETSMGTFWANNNQMNYVLFCYHKEKDNLAQMQEESNSKMKKSCLKVNRRESADWLIKDMLNAATYVNESKGTCRSEASPSHRTGVTRHVKENKHHVDGIKGRHRAVYLARPQDPCPQRRRTLPSGALHSLPQPQKGSQTISSVCCNFSNFLDKSNITESRSSPQVLTYHQIPLATLDWSNDKAHQSEVDGMDRIFTEPAKMTLSKSAKGSNGNDTAAAGNMWETFVNKRTEETISKESDVFDVWQVFINSSDCKTQSGVTKSQWLTTATQASPSNNEEPQASCEASKQMHVGQDAPNLAAAGSHGCHLPPDTRETSLANIALNSEDQEAIAELEYVRQPVGDNAATQDAPQRSETNSVTESAQEFSLMGAKPVSKGCVDSPSECREHEIWEQEGAGIMGRIGRNEPFTMHSTDLVTSSGESQTTDMTAMPESPNASSVDTISQEAGLQQGLSYSRDGKVTASAYNTEDDTLAFKETMRQGTADEERFVFSARRQGAEDRLTTKCAGNTVAKKEEIGGPQEIEKCHVSWGGGEGESQPDFSLECDSLEQCEQSETDASRLDGLGSVENSEAYLQNLHEEFLFGKPSPENGAQGKKGHKADTEAERKIIQALKEDEWPHKNNDSENVLARNNENTAVFPFINFSQTKLHEQDEKLNYKDEVEEVNATRMETNVTGEGLFQTEKDCCEIMQERQKPCEEIPPSTVTKEKPFSTTERTLQTEMIYQSDTSRSRPNPGVVEISWTHSHNVHKADVGCRMSLEELVLKEKDTSAALQPETLEGMEEDISQRDKDERLGIGKLKIETKKGDWAGNKKNPGGKSKNALVKLKEQELSAEVESSPRVEYQKMPEQMKNLVGDDGGVTLEQVGEIEMLPEGFVEEKIGKVWEEVGDCQYSVLSTWAEGDCHGEDGHLVKSIISREGKCKEILPIDCRKGQPFDERDEKIHIAAHTNTSARLRNYLNATTQSCPLSIGSTFRPLITDESMETKHRSVALQEIDKGESGDVYSEGCNKTLEKQSEDSKYELKDVPTWRTILYVLFHITRLLVCVLLVAGFFLVIFFYDFMTFCGLYSFSMCCWIYKFRSYQFFQKQQDKDIRNVAVVPKVEKRMD